MTPYIHHIPGRLRVRAGSFRCHSTAAETAKTRLLALDGVSEVRLNPKAGSITIHYDPKQLTRRDLMGGLLEECGCVEAEAGRHEPSAPVGAMLGQALLGAVVNKAIERSAVKLVSILL